MAADNSEPPGGINKHSHHRGRILSLCWVYTSGLLTVAAPSVYLSTRAISTASGCPNRLPLGTRLLRREEWPVVPVAATAVPGPGSHARPQAGVFISMPWLPPCPRQKQPASLREGGCRFCEGGRWSTWGHVLNLKILS